MITTELIGPTKVRRLAELTSRWPEARIRVVVDSWEGASAIDAGLARPLETLVDVNVGQDRCGVAPKTRSRSPTVSENSSSSRSSGCRGMRAICNTCATRMSVARRCDISMGRLEGAVANCGPADTRSTW